MKVLIDKRKFTGGPSVFRERISRAMSDLTDVQVTHEFNGSFDVELSIIRLLSKHTKPRVLRIDGCYYRPKQLQSNKNLMDAIRKVGAVIFQSNFSKRMVLKILKAKPRESHVIYNGIDQAYVASIQPNPRVEAGSFMAVAKWRDNKRPLSMLQGFARADTGRHFYIVGEGIPGKVAKKYKNVHLLGKRNNTQILAIMKACQYQIHLCHIDSCPNAVVEGLSCGLNVLCTNLGGTPELVQSDGVVLDIDEWDYQPREFANLDNVHPKKIARGIQRLLRKTERASRPDLDIRNTAKSYEAVLRGVM